MNKAATRILIAALLIFATEVYGQTVKSDHWSTAELLERSKHLKELAAKGEGSASETLEKYPHHYTMLAFRQRSGAGELHQNFADIFFILEGHAILITGGGIVDQQSSAPGEFHGKSVEGGSRQEVKAGDVVHIPAGMPHQMLVADGESITYFVVKAEEAR